MKWLVLLMLLPLVAADVRGAYRFLVNDERGQCAAFWPGDDFEYYELEPGWRDYEEGKLAHDFWNTTYWCEKIGYEYVGEITGPRHTRPINPWTKKAAAGAFAALGTLVVLKKSPWSKL